MSELNYDVAFFSITAQTNLHVGSGGENYGTIDNLVQRDATTGFPCIHASSLKGALREYFKHHIKTQVEEDKKVADMVTFLTHVFGYSPKDEIKKEEDDVKKNQADSDQENEVKAKKESPGRYKFFSADLLTIPVRSDKKLYYRLTCPWLLSNLETTLKQFGLSLTEEADAVAHLRSIIGEEAKVVHFGEGEAQLEEWDIKASGFKNNIALPAKLPTKLLGNDIAVAKDEVFAELVSDYCLPVLARNCLENGRSTNLWYEQLLPRETKLFFAVLYPKGDANFDSFAKTIKAHLVQIGANASVGYGFCKIEQIDTKPIV